MYRDRKRPRLIAGAGQKKISRSSDREKLEIELDFAI